MYTCFLNSVLYMKSKTSKYVLCYRKIHRDRHYADRFAFSYSRLWINMKRPQSVKVYNNVSSDFNNWWIYPKYAHLTMYLFQINSRNVTHGKIEKANTHPCGWPTCVRCRAHSILYTQPPIKAEMYGVVMLQMVAITVKFICQVPIRNVFFTFG
jgi:hypothetical protein